MDEVRDVLEERGKVYGEFKDHAAISRYLKEIFKSHRARPGDFQAHHDEALDMIANKLARVLNGDPNYKDNWVDIAGYSMLVADLCEV